MDVRDRDQWRAALADFGAASGGRLDVLFNNAGIGSGGQFLDMAPEEADRLIAINFGGVVTGIYRALPRSEGHPSELQSPMRTPSVVFCLKTNKVLPADGTA